VSQRLFLLELVRARYSEEEQAVKVVGIGLVGVLEGDDGEIVLVILLVELAEHPPGLSVLLVVLHLSLEAANRLLNQALLD